MPGHGIGITLIYTLSLNVNTRGYDHLMGGMSILTPDLREEWGITRELLARLGEERYGDPAIFRDNKWAYHPRIVQAECDFEHMMVMADMAGTCKFATQYNQPVEGIELPEWSGFLSAATGESFTSASPSGRRAADHHARALLQRPGGRETPRRLPLLPLVAEEVRGAAPSVHRSGRCRSRRRSTTGSLTSGTSARLRPAERDPDLEELMRSGLEDVADDLDSRGVLTG